MDDYSTEEDNYRIALERLVMDAGLPLPPIYAPHVNDREQQTHYARLRQYRENKKAE